MDIKGTAQADTYDQGATPPVEWTNYYGYGGNDTIRMWSGQVIGGQGNDRIEQIPSTEWWRVLFVAYWDAPAGAVVDLAAGTAQDGWGTVDTLIGVDGVNGGGRDDRFYGDAGNNQFTSGGGKDLIDGREGIDSVVLPWVRGAPANPATVSIQVAIDGRTATITSPVDSTFRLDLVDVERFAYDGSQAYLDLADFITPAAVAQQGLVGLPTQRWNAGAPLGSGAAVSFSFVEVAPSGGVGATGFRAFTAAERQAVRDILAQTSALCGLDFTEVGETAGASGQMRFGVSQQAQTKGVAGPPGLSAGDASAGDVWMDEESMAALAPGTEGLAALWHEIGHALGLRHPRNVDPGDAWTQQVREADDTVSLSAMSGTASVAGLFRADWGTLDIAALRHLYGARSLGLGDSVHLVGGADAQALRTVVDDGGTDTLDAAQSPCGVAIDLEPGHRSSVGLTAEGGAAIDNLALGVDSWIENAVGSAYDDVLLGNARGNRLTGGLGNDWIDGADGADAALFAGARADFLLSQSYGLVYAAAADGAGGFDTLSRVETLVFADRTVDLTMGSRIQGVSAADLKTLEELYVGFFNRVPEAEGLGYWIGQLKAGTSLTAIANQFYDAGVQFGVYSAGFTDQQFVAQVYDYVLGRGPNSTNPPPQADIDYWVAYLNDPLHPAQTKGTMVLQMLSDTHTYFETGPFAYVAQHLNNKAFVANYYAVQQGLSMIVQDDNISFGMALAQLITPTDTSAAIEFIGVNPFSMF